MLDTPCAISHGDKHQREANRPQHGQHGGRSITRLADLTLPDSSTLAEVRARDLDSPQLASFTGEYVAWLLRGVA